MMRCTRKIARYNFDSSNKKQMRDFTVTSYAVCCAIARISWETWSYSRFCHFRLKVWDESSRGNDWNKVQRLSLQRDLESTQNSLNNWDGVNLNWIQGFHCDDSIGTSISPVMTRSGTSGHPLAGPPWEKKMWEQPSWRRMEKVSGWVLPWHAWQNAIILICVCCRHKTAGTTQNMPKFYETKSQKEVDLDPTSLLDHVDRTPTHKTHPCSSVWPKRAPHTQIA